MKNVDNVKDSMYLSSIDKLSAAGNVWVMTDKQRAEMTLSARDTDVMPKVKDAGKTMLQDGQKIQVMHNGLKVLQDGYQGPWMSKIISDLKGNHEPQEEIVFHEVINRADKGNSMMELGSWWSYYSMWFAKSTSGKAFCCEPDPDNLNLGKANAKLNKLNEKDITFINAANGSQDGEIESFRTESGEEIKIPLRSVDSLVKEFSIEKLEILHMDIQGFELEGLAGAQESISAGKVRFLFVSTHHYAISNDPLLHKKCLDFILKNKGHIIASHTILESSSGDGLIVASFDKRDRDFKVHTSTQKTDNSLFRSAEEDTAILWDAHNTLLEYIFKLEKELEDYKRSAAERNNGIKAKVIKRIRDKKDRGVIK